MFNRRVPEDWDTWSPAEVLHHLVDLEPWQRSGTLWDYRSLPARAGARTTAGKLPAPRGCTTTRPALGVEGEASRG
jgi:hypothetical protein